MTDRRRARGGLASVVGAALAGGVTAVVLREKDLATDELVSIGRPVAEACRTGGALLFVNGDVEAALRLRADGVHLGYGATPVAAARAALPAEALVGRSTHDPDELRAALAEGADYVLYSPVWDTPSKRGILAPRGVEGLAAAVGAAGDVPVVALGGVTAGRVAAALAAGAAGVAVQGALLDADDPRAAAAALVAAGRSA